METPLDTTVVVGRIDSAEPFPEARTPKLGKLRIEIGGREVRSAAQLLYHHSLEGLPGTRVLCATDLGTVNIAGFESEALTLGVPGEDVPLGGLLH